MDLLERHHPLRLHSDLGPGIYVEEMQGRMELSRLFRFDLKLLAEPLLPVSFDKIMGMPVSIRMSPRPGIEHHFHGIVRSFEKKRRNIAGIKDRRFVPYRAVVVPKMWLLSLRRQSRVFQQQSVPDILKALFAELRPHVKFDLHGQYPKRDYCVQYEESDFAFASRLMEEEGIHYYFEHSAEAHTLVVADTSALAPDIEGLADVRYDDAEGGLRHDARIHSWRKRQRVTSAIAVSRDIHFELGSQPPRQFQNLEAKHEVASQVKMGQVDHTLKYGANAEIESREYPGGFAEWFDGIGPDGNKQPDDLANAFPQADRLARLRGEQRASRALGARGAGNCMTFVPGRAFRLIGAQDDDGKYVLTSVELFARGSGYRSGSGEGFECRNTFRCLPVDLPYRPKRLTRRPRIAGTQTAIVVGPTGKQVFVDPYGRVKVQFHWDRLGQYDSHSSCWVRVAQVWAGNRFGAFFWPRVGQEVVIGFEEGNPDRPVIIGSVYNAVNMPPFELPAGVLSSGFKSCSLGGDPLVHFNDLILHDEPDNEHVQIHSETHTVISDEVSRTSQSAGPTAEIVGGFSWLPSGSGSGGGIATFINIAGVATDTYDKITGKDPTTNWYNSYFCKWLPGKYATVEGWNQSVNFGSGSKHVWFGDDIKIVCDPVTLLLDNLGSLMDSKTGKFLFSSGDFSFTPFSWLFNLGPVPGGDVGTVFGPKVGQAYGDTKLDVLRGTALKFEAATFSEFDKTHPLVDLVAKIMALLLAMLGMYLDFIIMWRYRVGDDKLSSGLSEVNSLCNFIMTRVHGLLITLETVLANGKTRVGKQKAAADSLAAADAALKSARQCIARALYRVLDGAADNVEANLSLASINLRGTIQNIKASVRQLNRETTEAVADVYQQQHATLNRSQCTGPSFEFQAIEREGSGDATIKLLATNGREAEENKAAKLNLDGNKGLATLESGKSSITLNNKQIFLSAMESNAELGFMTSGNLFLGSSGIDTPSLEIMPELEVAGPKVLKLANGNLATGPSIEMTKESLKLKCGTSSIELSEAGIRLSAGAAKLNLDLAGSAMVLGTYFGVNVDAMDATCVAAISMDALELRFNGAQVSTVAPITNLK